MQAEYDFSHGVRSKPRTASGGGDGMTGTEQNIAIAEACGVDIEPVINPKKGWSLTEAEIPPFTTDLNAMHEAVLLHETNSIFVVSYCENLKFVILNRAGLKYPGLVSEFRLIAATASEQSEAFLRALGKWKG